MAVNTMYGHNPFDFARNHTIFDPKMNSPFHPAIRSRRRGFSLVEVTIALGIVGFAAVTVMALVPVGLKSLRNSIDQTVESQIGQQISSDILQTPFAQVGSFTNYYDNEGFPVSKTNDAIFTAEITPSTNFSYPGSELLGGLTIPLTNSLKSLQVRVTTRESKNLSPRYQHSFSLLLARREQLTNL